MQSPQSKNSSSVKADWTTRRRRLPSAMKHEIAVEWNGNETKVIARDTRRILQREWTTRRAVQSRTPDNARASA